MWYPICSPIWIPEKQDQLTCMAWHSQVDNATQASENEEHVVGGYLDFSKAFDSVDHVILLEKLHHQGFRSCAYDWFTSYLPNTSQFVSYNGIKSNLNVKYGVPQGSTLRLLLCLLYISDFAFACNGPTQYYMLMIAMYFSAVTMLMTFSMWWMMS